VTGGRERTFEGLKGKAPSHQLHSGSIVVCTSNYDDFDRQSCQLFPVDSRRIKAGTSEHGLNEFRGHGWISLLLVGLACR
jgi:hypothetical protein